MLVHCLHSVLKVIFALVRKSYAFVPRRSFVRIDSRKARTYLLSLIYSDTETEENSCNCQHLMPNAGSNSITYGVSIIINNSRGTVSDGTTSAR